MTIDRRDFLKAAAASVTASLTATRAEPAEPHGAARAQALTEKDKLYRIASCSWPIRSIFKSRGGGSPASQQLKQQYGEITMLDFPQFTRDTFPGVTHMDLYSGLFGDVTDDTMFVQ